MIQICRKDKKRVLDDSGIAQEIVFGTLKTHDMEQCREMLRNTTCLRENDILINDRGSCHGDDKKDDEYYVFMSTDTTKTAKQIINIYEMRPEIEEDFRQMKDFWKLEDFKSTQYNYVIYHIIMTLMGYLFFSGIQKSRRKAGLCREVAAYRSKKP